MASSESRNNHSPRLADAVVTGFVAAPHGVRGTVKVKAPGSGQHLREGMAPVVGGERRRILAARETPKGFLLDLEGVTDRAEAAALRGSELLLDRRELDDPGEEEFYVGDLEGLDAYDEEGSLLGRVAEVFDTPAHEVLVVRDDHPDGPGAEHYVPFTYQHVPEVDLSGGRVVVNLPREE